MTRKARSRRAVLARLLAGGLGLVAASADAGTVAVSVTQTTQLRDGVLTTRLTIANHGDEAAEAVTPALSFRGRTVRGETSPLLEPGESIEATLALPAAEVGIGRWPFLIAVDYADARQYRLQSLQMPSLVVGEPPTAQVVMKPIVAPRLDDDEASLRIQLKNTGERERTVTLEVRAPPGLEAVHPERPIVLEAGGEETVLAKVVRRGPLPGGELPVFVSAEYEEDGIHQASVHQSLIATSSLGPLLGLPGLLAGTVAALLLLAGAVRGLHGHGRLLRAGTDVVLLAAILLYMLMQIDPRLVFTVTTITGGDTPSHFHPAQHLLDVLLPQGRLIGWDMGNYAGYPLFQFYFPLPFALMALFAQAMPLEVAFKLVTVLGPLTLPLATYYAFRALDYPFPTPVVAAGLVLPFLFQEGNSMWGGNVPSMLAGEFCHAVGLSLAVVSVGSVHRGLQSGRGWFWNGLLLAACSLAHTYAFLFAALASLALLLERRSFGRDLQILVKTYALAFCLMGFWAIPLLEKVGFTTAWVYVWRIQSLSELVPRVLLPLLAGAALAALVTRLGFRSPPGSHARLFLIVLLGSLVFYLGAPTLDLVDIRFVPGAQLMLAFLSADLLATGLRRLPLRATSASLLVVAAIVWTDAHVSFLPEWVRWNYEGFERKPAWPTFQGINQFLKGDYADPRVAYEFSPRTNMFGSVRSFEAIPHFAGRQTLEGTLIHSSINAPFIYYIQSEISEVSSHPIPGYSYSIFDAERGTEHLRLFNVRDLVVVSDTAIDAFGRSPEYEEVFRSEPYRVFRLTSNSGDYVVVPEYWPVLYETDDWRRSFYRWFKRTDLLDVPLVASELLTEAQHERFELRASDLDELPRRPLERPCEIDERIEHAAVRFTTSCPGLPHVVRISWFPNWRVEGADVIYPVSPAFMLVFPEGREVMLSYGRTPGDWLGMTLTGGTLALGAALALGGRVRRRRARDAATDWPRTRADAAFAALGRRRGLLLGALSVVSLALMADGAYERLERNRPQELFNAAWKDYHAEDFEPAIRGFRALIASEHGYWLEAPSRLYAGFAHLQLDQPDEAAELLEGLLEEFPDSPLRPEALYHLGTARYRQGARERAAQAWREIVARHPNERWADYAADRLEDLASMP